MSTINDKTFAACQNLRKALAATKLCDVTFQHSTEHMVELVQEKMQMKIIPSQIMLLFLHLMQSCLNKAF